MTPSVSQSSGFRLRRAFSSVRPIPSFPCSSSMSRSCELLLFTMIGPILRRNIPSLYIGCTFEVSLVRRITDLSWKVDDIRRRWKLGLSHSPEKSVMPQKHKQNRPKTTGLNQNPQERAPANTFMEILCSSVRLVILFTGKTFHNFPLQLSSSPLQATPMSGHAE